MDVAFNQEIRHGRPTSTMGTRINTNVEAVNGEMQQLNSEVDRIAQKTTFNGKALLDNSLNTTVCATTTLVQQGFTLSACASGISVSKLDVSGAMGGHTYSFTSATAGTLTLTDTTTNVSQTVAVTAMSSSATAAQTLTFSQLGVTLGLSGFSAASGAAANIVNNFTLAASDTITTASSGGALTLQIGANTGNALSVSIKDGESTSLGTL